MKQGIFMFVDLERSTYFKRLLQDHDKAVAPDSTITNGEKAGIEMMQKHNQKAIQIVSGRAGSLVKILGDAVLFHFTKALPAILAAEEIMAFWINEVGLSDDKKYFNPDFNKRVGNNENDEKYKVRIRPKISLDFFRYDVVAYEKVASVDGSIVNPRDLCSFELDRFFRISEIAWRFQILMTERFLRHFERNLALSDGSAFNTENYMRDMVKARDNNREPEGISVSALGKKEFWLTDARRVVNLKGLNKPENLFLYHAQDPRILTTKDKFYKPIFRIKMRQNHHALIFIKAVTIINDSEMKRAKDSVNQEEESLSPNFLVAMRKLLYPYDDKKLPKLDERIDDRLTLCIAGEVLGEDHYLLRISYSDNKVFLDFWNRINTLKNQFNILQRYTHGVLTDNFWVNPSHEYIFEIFKKWVNREIYVVTIANRYSDSPKELHHNLDRDHDPLRKDVSLFRLLLDKMIDDDRIRDALYGKDKAEYEALSTGLIKAVHVIETGVLEDNTTYAIVISGNFEEYRSFLINDIGVSLDECHSRRVINIDKYDNGSKRVFKTFRYDLVDGIYLEDARGVVLKR